VTAELRSTPGVRFALGIGEAPIGLQGTLSVWRDSGALQEFAYSGPAHRAVIARTPIERWYAEELFARFAVLEADPLFGIEPAEAVEPAEASIPGALPPIRPDAG
jgi:hypothetical protein